MAEPRCAICSADTASFLTRNDVPVNQNLICTTQAAALSVPRGQIHLTCCERCGFVSNAAYDSARLSYGADYDNNQSYSREFAQYVDGLIHHLVQNSGVRGKRIVEVGCGKGYFLERLVAADPGNTGIGFDTTYEGPGDALNGRVRFVRQRFSADSADVRPDVVICRHVIEHVPDPLELLRSIRVALASSPGARLFLETPSVEWIFLNEAIWDIFYEHCSYFSSHALQVALAMAGFRLERVTHTFSDQYLWAEASPQSWTPPSVSGPEIATHAKKFGVAEQELCATWRSVLLSSARSGPVAIWGAGAKGATLASLVDPDRKKLKCIVDVNPNKQGRFLAGTGHPIVAPPELLASDVRSALVMNPNYLNENRAIVAALGWNGELFPAVRRSLANRH